VKPVLLVSVAGAVALSWWADLIRRPAASLFEDEHSEALKTSDEAALDQNGVVAGE